LHCTLRLRNNDFLVLLRNEKLGLFVRRQMVDQAIV
jgi:hypothetical protein